MHQPAPSPSCPQALLALFVAALASTPAQALPYYLVTDLGSLGGSLSDAEDINNAGQVVGYAQLAGNTAYHATLWQQDGRPQDLGTLPGETHSWAYGINELGQIVGDSGHSTGGKGGTVSTNLPVLWQNGSIQALSASVGSAQDIDEAGRVAGYTLFKGAETHATLWQGGTQTDLQKILGSNSSVQAINDSGQMAGYLTSSVWPTAVYWASPSAKSVIGNLGAYQDINNAGQMVGVSGKVTAGSTSGGRPFIAAVGGAPQALPTLGGSLGAALGINESGWAVGWAQTASAAQHAALWQAGQAFDLNSLLAPASAGLTLVSANAINDLGQIVGQLSNGHAYLANPAGAAVWVGGGGSWETGGNWEQGFKPGKLQTPVIAPGGGAIAVTGPVGDSEVAGLTLGGGAGSVDLSLNGGRLVVADTVQVEAGSRLGVALGSTLAAGSYLQHGGMAEVDGSLQAASITIQDGSLDGTGSLQGVVTLGPAASLNPGHGAGVLNIVGDFILNGTLNIEIAGPALSDALNITGNADFSLGTVNFSFIGGFLPQAGDLFQWLNISGSVAGLDASRIHVAGLPAGLGYGLETGHALRISAPSTALPEPGALALFAMGLPALRRPALWPWRRIG